MIFELVHDFAVVLQAMPTEHPRHRIPTLLSEAIRREIHFVDRHRAEYPQALVQSQWNHGWWYDSPAAAAYYVQAESPGKVTDVRLPSLLDAIARGAPSLRGMTGYLNC